MDDTVTFPENWSAPPELTRERPRPVRPSTAGIVLTVLSTAMIIAALPSALAMRVSDARTDARAQALRSDGQDVVANVTRLRRVGKDKEPRVSYVFVLDDMRYTADVKAPLAIWSDLEEGSHLTVRFLPSDPAVNYPRAWVPSRLGRLVPFITAGFLMAMGGFLWFMRRRDRRLLEDGLPVAGVVTRCHRMKGGYSARYKFRSEDGEVRKGRGVAPRRYEVGETLCVVVDPDNPRRNAPYPMKLYRVREAG